MIIQIDGIYFNPEIVVGLRQEDKDVRMFYGPEAYHFKEFKNWKIEDLAAEINRCIEEFHIDNYVQALKRFQGIIGNYDGKKSLKA